MCLCIWMGVARGGGGGGEGSVGRATSSQNLPYLASGQVTRWFAYWQYNMTG